MKSPRLLPHEVLLLKSYNNRLEDQRVYLAGEKSEAQGTAYDWHDNAGLDAVEEQQGMVVGKMREIKSILEKAEIVTYPEPNDTHVRLGSLVVGHASFGALPFVIVGQLLTDKETYEKLWHEHPIEAYKSEELTVVSPISPIGKAAVGAELGSTISYEAGARSISMEIEHVDQLWVPAHFANK